MKIKILFLICLSLTLTGCFLDPYTNEKYGEQVINSWFTYKDGSNDLGAVRKRVEDISSIDEIECKFVEKYNNNYIFKCTLTYKELGETVIPFSQAKKLALYAVFTPNKDNYTYKVYNSSSEENIWLSDDELK